MKYRALIFDFFGVLCSEIAPPWFEKHFPPSETQNLKEKYFDRADVGKISETELFGELSKASNIPPENISQELNDYVVLNQELIQFIRELKKEYKIGLCTNAVSSFFRKIIVENDLEKLFDTIVVSSEIGYAKPSPEIYLKTLESLGVKASEAVLIDDSVINIKAGEKLGIKGILFKSNNEIKIELSRLNI